MIAPAPVRSSSDLQGEKEKLVKLLDADRVDEAELQEAASRVTDREAKVKTSHLGMLVRVKNTHPATARVREGREQIADAFRKVFREDIELVYEISHNLVQAETHPEHNEVWVHRKGATRALPAGHPALAGTRWEATGHPVLIPGSNRDYSYILMPEAGAHKSGFSVNHGAGGRLSRGEAMRQLDQRKVDEQYRREDILVNLDGRVPLDESSQRYKSAEEVVAAVVAAGLARVEHTLWPAASIKGTEEGAARDCRRKHKAQERSRDRARAAARKTKGHV